MQIARSTLVVSSAVLVGLATLSCRGEAERSTPEVKWSPGGTGSVVRTTTFEAGPATPDPIVRNPYEGDQKAIASGKALYEGFNCAGCHGSLGGGGIGPPFADTEWIYGSAPENIFQSVAQGRPDGMPAFGGKIPEQTLWMIVAYVQSLTPKAATEGGEEGVGTHGEPTIGGAAKQKGS